MKTSRRIVFLLALLAVACQRESDDTAPQQGVCRIIASAAWTEAENPDAKTLINPTDETQILWSPQEKIRIFHGSIADTFYGENTAPAASAVFTSSSAGSLGTYSAVYPGDSAFHKSGNVHVVSLPSVQTGEAGSFEDNVFVEAGMSSTSTIRFKAVCSGIRFKVGRSDIKTVSLRGNAGERIAGDFSFSFDGDGNPIAGEGSESLVVLNAPDGGCFIPGEWYYMVTLPVTFSNGITLMASTGTSIGQFKMDTPVSFNRGIFKNKPALDEAMTWSVPGSEQVCYGTQNCFLLSYTESKQISFDISPYYMAPGWLRTGLPVDAPMADNYDVEWDSADMTVSMDVSARKISVSAPTTGDMLISIRNGGDILWSFHIWVEHLPFHASGSSSEFMALPPLGGEERYFQWGRMTPLLQSSIPSSGSSSDIVAGQILSPLVFFRTHSGVDYDWLSDHDDTLWGGDDGPKTVWDPCPEGWRVPSWSQFENLDASQLSKFPYYGYMDVNGYLQDKDYVSLYWTRSTQDFYAKSLYSLKSSIHELEEQNNVRALALPIRCVRE